MKTKFIAIMFAIFFFHGSVFADMPPAPQQNAVFIILCLAGSSSTECSDSQDVVDAFNKKFGPNYAQMIDGSNSSTSEILSYMSKYYYVFNNIRYFMLISTHGFENSPSGHFDHDSGTIFYWQCTTESGGGAGDCSQSINSKDLMNISMKNIAVAFFDECTTHATSDNVDAGYPDDNTATSWIHLYNKNAFAIGFNHPANFPGTQDLMKCVWMGILNNFSASVDANQLSSVINTCKNQTPNAQIPGNNQVLPGTLYFTGNGANGSTSGSSSLPVAKVSYIDIFQNPIGGYLSYNNKTVTLPKATSNDILEDDDFLSNFGDINKLIATRQLNSIQYYAPNHAPINCFNIDDQANIQVPFSVQFNTLDIIIENGAIPTCLFTYDYRTDH